MNHGATRRGFLRASVSAGGVAVFGFTLPLAAAGTGGSPAELHSWILIHPDNRVTVRLPQSEIGQGASTALVQIIADEIDLDLALVDWEFYDPQTNRVRNNVYVHTATLASWGIKVLFQPLRQAGAQIRAMLVAAAADALNSQAHTITIQPQHRLVDAAGRDVSFAGVAQRAAALPVPPAESVRLKRPADWRYIGKELPRNDALAKTTGAAMYGIDVRLPGMKYAAVRQSPVFGGRLVGFDAAAVLGLPGVQAVVRIQAGPTGYTVPPTLWDVIDWAMDDAVAVVADSWWQAEQALKQLPIEWDEGRHAGVDSTAINAALASELKQAGETIRSEGDAAGMLQTATNTVEAEYHYPFVEHAPMEPMNCTAIVRARSVEAWAPTQYGDEALRIAAYAAGVALKDAKFHLTLAGGGFGRRLHNDYVSQAVQVARELPGTPVKLIWSREENTRRSYYPPVMQARFRGALGNDGLVSAWDAHVAQGTSVYQPYGLSRLVVPVPHIRMRYSSIETPPPFAWMRGVGHTQCAWMNHCFLSELAAAAGVDPLEFYLQHLDPDRVDRAREDHDDAVYRINRFRRLLEHVRAQAGAARATRGHGRGYAAYDMSYLPGYRAAGVAVALDVHLDEGGKLTLGAVQAAVDCGVAVNPGLVRQQIEGGILFGLSNALYGKITLRNGQVEQSNFHDYRLLRLADAPDITVDILPADEAPVGVGEGAVPVVIGALLDAIYAAGGPRVRRLPVVDNDLSLRSDA